MSAAASIFAVDIPSTPFPHCPQASIVNVSELPRGRDPNPGIRISFNQSSVGSLSIATNNISVMPIEYLECRSKDFYGTNDSTPYIDTGYVMGPGSGLRLVFSANRRTAPSGVFGCTDADGTNEWFLDYQVRESDVGTFMQILLKVGTNTIRAKAADTNVVQAIYANYKGDGRLVGLDTNNIPNLVQSVSSACLFGVNIPNSAIGPLLALSTIRVYECQITEGTNMVMDLRPVRTGIEESATEGAMRDMISGAIYRNARPLTAPRRREFVCGPDVQQ